jgi:CheY-like chemotaxis protein
VCSCIYTLLITCALYHDYLSIQVRLLREWEQSLSNGGNTDNNNTHTNTATGTTISESTSTNTTSDQQQQHHQHQPQETATTADTAAVAAASGIVTATTSGAAPIKRRHQFVAVMSADLNDSAVSVLAKGCDAYIPKPVSITTTHWYVNSQQ